MTSLTPVEIQELINGFKQDKKEQDKKEQYSALQKRFYEQFYRYVASIASEELHRRGEINDVVQEAFLKALRAIGSLRDPLGVSSWLKTIVTNLCKDCNREQMREPSSLEAITKFGNQPVAKDSAKTLDTLDNRECWEKALEILSPQMRKVIRLRIDGLNYEQIASELDLSVVAVRVYLYRAKGKLTDHIRRMESG